MISEKTFCLHYSTFWHETLPNLEAVVRGINLGYERLWYPLHIGTEAKRRDLISETGYRFSFYLDKNLSPSELEKQIETSAKEVFEELRGDASPFWNEEYYLSDAESKEILKLGRAIHGYLANLPPIGAKIVRPSYLGHGILAACFGDFEKGDSLIEMKYVARNFRGSDVRQILTYAALRYYSTGFEYSSLYLINPLRGTHFVTSPAEIVASAAGITSIDFYKRMSYVLSSGEISH